MNLTRRLLDAYNRMLSTAARFDGEYEKARDEFWALLAVLEQRA